MENNVIQGRIIKSSMKDWDLEFYIDSEDYNDADTLFADVFVPEFNVSKTNLSIRINPSVDAGHLNYYSDKEDGYRRYYSEWETRPDAWVSDSDLTYSDGGYEVSEDEVMQRTGLTKDELIDLRREIVDVAPDYLRNWLEENYDRFED